MAFIVPNEGEVLYEDRNVFSQSGYTYKIGLYKSSHTPAASDVLSDYTSIKADFPGYFDQLPGWPAGAVTESGKATKTSGTVTFTRTTTGTAQTIYGYYIWVDTGTNFLVGGENFSSPIVMENENDQISFAIKATLQSAN